MRTLLSFLLACAPYVFGQAEKPDPVENSPSIPVLYQSIVITASPVEPALDRRNEEVFRQTLFSRDDQVFQLVASGIDAGQHEGGGKSIEVRRFGFNLDHGGVNGGLKVLVDDVQQNQGTQGHGQGYLGSLKTLSPELVQEVNIINGPFSAEYGDFSGLGVVHIRLKESLPDQWTARLQGGSFNTKRAFLAFSPDWKNADAFLAYEGSRTDGPFLDPLRYKRDNITANWTRRISQQESIGLKFNGGLNSYYSSGQIPLDEVAAGRLDPFGYIDNTNGGRVRAGTLGVYYRKETEAGAAWRVDGFASRSLFDLYSNFTFFLFDPLHGDAFQQHDSRLQEGANVQYLRPHRIGAVQGLLTAGGNFHANQINVGLYPRDGRVPTGVTTRADAHVTNGAGYLQDNFIFLGGRLRAGAGLRFDRFQFAVRDLVDRSGSGAQSAGRLQPKLNLAWTPTYRWPLTLYANYGRGISSSDARGVVKSPSGTLVATTDFYQFGAAHQFSRVSLSTDLFWIDRSNELVYVPDDGSLEFTGPSRAYGYEAKASVQITQRLSLNGGITKVLNAFYRGTAPRTYVERAPHFVSNAGLTLSNWKGWSGSLRMRAISHYREDPQEASVVAAGHTVFDLSLVRTIRRGLDFNLALDNLTDRLYYETQNWFESRLPGQMPAYRIHATPGYPLTLTAGLTFRFRGK
jgi:hypothetical protein